MEGVRFFQSVANRPKNQAGAGKHRREDTGLQRVRVRFPIAAHEQIGTIRLLTVRLSNDPPARFLEQSGDLSLRLVPPLSGIRAFEKLWIRHTVSWPG